MTTKEGNYYASESNMQEFSQNIQHALKTMKTMRDKPVPERMSRLQFDLESENQQLVTSVVVTTEHS